MRSHRPVRAAERAADAAGLDLRIHRIDELADRHVRIVAVHEIDVDMVGLQPVERLGELLADHVGIAERRMRALADDHRLLAHAAVFQPFAKQLFGVAGAIDKAGVEQIAAGLEEGIEQDRARGEGAEILEAERHDRGRLRQARNGALADRACRRPQRPAGDGVGAQRGLLDLIFEPDGGAPFVEHAQIAEAVGPVHARPGEFLPAGAGSPRRRHRPRRNRHGAFR